MRVPIQSNGLDPYLKEEPEQEGWPWQLTFMTVCGCVMIAEILIIAALSILLRL
jgi:hypothetical protein